MINFPAFIFLCIAVWFFGRTLGSCGVPAVVAIPAIVVIGLLGAITVVAKPNSEPD